jgi:alpha-beta hydrolase superfamily lysophospholipase
MFVTYVIIQIEEQLADYVFFKINIVWFSCFSFSELVTMVEDALTKEHATCPNKPIYLLGSSFGGCLALSVAARNPHIDLILILVNPGMQGTFLLYKPP